MLCSLGGTLDEGVFCVALHSKKKVLGLSLRLLGYLFLLETAPFFVGVTGVGLLAADSVVPPEAVFEERVPLRARVLGGMAPCKSDHKGR